MPDGGATDGHASLPDNGNICIELKFDEARSEAVTILLHLECTPTSVDSTHVFLRSAWTGDWDLSNLSTCVGRQSRIDRLKLSCGS